MQLKAEIINFIKENFLYGQDGDGLDHDASFLENGMIDSTGVLELVSFVERTYGVSVADDELIPDNFDSVNKLTTFIAKKKETAVGHVQAHAGQ
jgi:acyl carrier protein